MSERAKNRVLLFTGDGKGKSTAAFGMVLRASGHGQRVCVLQFIKARRDTGEVRALGRLEGVEAHVCGEGFVRPGRDEPAGRHRLAAEAGLALAAEKLGDPAYDLVVLDEVCGAVSLGLLSARAVADVVAAAAPGKVIVMTGRNACRELIDAADTVSGVTCVKHGMSAGWPAQAGVEF